jgi:hypothetical protein
MGIFMPIFLLIMVNRNVLKKLSGFELEKYVIEGNRFTPEAVQMAFEVLEERGRTFTDEEKISIQNIIQNKRESEIAKKTKKLKTGETILLQIHLPSDYIQEHCF